MFEEDPTSRDPEPPTAPTRPKRRSIFNLRELTRPHHFLEPHLFSGLDPSHLESVMDETQPQVDEEDPGAVSFHLRRLKHHQVLSLKPFYVVAGAAIQPGAELPFRCTLHCASSPEETSVVLVLALTGPGADVSDDKSAHRVSAPDDER